jgi:hypothetical protein
MSDKDVKQEAIRRMKHYGLSRNAISAFEHNNDIWMTEPPLGGLYEIDNDMLAKIRSIEKAYGIRVYHVVRAYTHFGQCDSLLYVSVDNEDWHVDRGLEQDPNNLVYSYTINNTYPDCSEFGILMVRESFGGLLRIN